MEYVQTTPVFSVVWLEHYEQKKNCYKNRIVKYL